MKKSLEEYIKKIDNMFESKKKIEWHNIMHEHMDKIEFYQHERLIHLIVTLLVSILSMMLFLYALNNPSIGVFVLLIIFICLLIPYILHYYFLENNVQKMYEQYDRIKNNMK